MVHLEPSSLAAPWQSQHKRHTLIAGAFGVGHGPKEVVELRTSLQRACDALPNHICYFHRLSGPLAALGRRLRAVRNHSRSTASGAEPAWHSIARVYWNSTFCLQPPGDAVSRKAIVDSLLLGCIPVLFHRGQVAQWPWHWGSWQADASVVIDMDAVHRRKVDPLAFLAAISPSRITRMQATIAEHAHRMHYAAVDTAQLPSHLLQDIDRTQNAHRGRQAGGRAVRLCVAVTHMPPAEFDSCATVPCRNPMMRSISSSTTRTCALRTRPSLHPASRCNRALGPCWMR
jgi:hypothetical protein